MTNDDATAGRPPDGIGEREMQPLEGWRQHASPLSLVVFGTVVLLALAGVLGHERTWATQGETVNLEVHMPEVIRNGEFFEMRVTVRADQPIEQLVVAIDQAVWEDVTVNTMVPAATEEANEDGVFRFTFAELAAGSTFLLKIDGQVNPDLVGANAGTVSVLDGEAELAAVDVTMEVRP